ncbi:MAG: hypothetical protein AAB521_00720 [Patescibacteria group bacterium]
MTVEREKGLKEREQALHGLLVDFLTISTEPHQPTFWQALSSSGLSQYRHRRFEGGYDTDEGTKRIIISCIEPLKGNPVILEDPNAGKKWLIGSFYKSISSGELGECEEIFYQLTASMD